MSALRSLLTLSAVLGLLACSSVSPDPAIDNDGGGGGGPVADGGPIQNGQSCQAGNDLIYVVDQDYRLLSFDPQAISGGNPFTLVGNLDCAAASSWPSLGSTGPATPFSMSVDRNGFAWVLYTSGEIFKVSINDARCESTGFQKGQAGFELFGMGFVSNAAGSNEETLFLAGGNATQTDAGKLGSVSSALQVSPLGSLPSAENNPEMTGTGEGDLYAYFPGFFDNFIARLDKTNSTIIQEWPLSSLDGLLSAWAFAHWGGKFYLFVTTEGLSSKSEVRVFDPATGQDTVAVANMPYVVVGAGVSTCAPIVVE